MQVQGPAHLHGPQSITAPHNVRTTPPLDAGGFSPIQDDIRISDAGLLVSQVNDLPEIRGERVQELRAAIESGTYMTEERLSGAVERLLDEIA